MEPVNMRAALSAKPMNAYQWFVVAICVCLNVIDGFDVLVMAFTAASVSESLGLTATEVGILLSAGLFGMGIGAVFLAPWADRWGRKTIILISLLLTGAGMTVSALTTTAVQLGLCRFATGLGIGGLLVASNVLTGEYSSARWRSLAISLQSMGYALGGIGGGILAAALIGRYGWHSVFLTGGVLSFVFFVIVAVWLPESVDYLLTRRPAGALEKIRVLCGKTGLPPLEKLPEAAVVAGRKGWVVRDLLSGNMKTPTIAIWLAFFSVMFGFYCILSWTPKLLTTAGMTAGQGINTGILMNVGGIFGAVLIGFLGARFNIRSVQMFFLLLTALCTAWFALSLGHLSSALTAAFFLGVLANGCVAGLYAVVPTLYDAPRRAAGVGTAIGIGRSGSILSPLMAGFLLDTGWTPTALLYLNAVVFLIAMTMVLQLKKAASQL